MDFVYASFKEIQNALQNAQTSCLEIVSAYLQTISERNGTLNAFLEVYADEALQRADQIDQKIKDGKAGKLAGMVVGIKDVLCYKNHTLQASSKILDNFQSQFTATAVQRLVEEDAIIIGRQNCDEFAMGSTNESSAFGTVRNAANTNHVPGGSSGGSAVAVQADMCLVSLGSDTGGSVRQPASFCGVLGMKPTYSRISRHGLIAYASSFDSIGVFAKNLEDIALVLETIAGKDKFDSTVSQRDVPPYSQLLSQSTKKYKIAYYKEIFEGQGVDESIKSSTASKIQVLKDHGHIVEAISFPLLKYILPTYYILTMAEASTNLSRYDGVRYGHRSKKAVDLMSMFKLSRAEGFGKEVKRRIMLGTFVLSASYYDAYFTKAQKVRRLIKEKSCDLFADYDFVISPTTPTTAPIFGAFSDNPIQMYLADIFSVQANVIGVPSISIPNGKDHQGLPIGLQIMANSFEESKLLSFAKHILS